MILKPPARGQEAGWPCRAGLVHHGTFATCVPGTLSPLVEIVVGPCPQPDLTCEALKLLVGQDPAYKDVKVRLSETPYRYW